MIVLPEHQRLMYKSTNLFLQVLLNEDKKVKGMDFEDFKKTLENPLIRAREDTHEICKEVKDSKSNQEVFDQRRAQLRANDVDLRELIRHLQAAEICKQMVDQKLASDKAKEDAKRQKRLEDLEYDKERKKNAEFMRQEEIKDIHRKQVFRQGLLKQINDRIDLKKEDYKELLKDREDMKKVLEGVAEQRKAEQRAVEIYRSQCREQVAENIRLQKLRKQRELAEKIDHSQKYDALTKEQDRIKMEIIQGRKQDIARKQAISEEIGINVHKIKSDKLARQNLLIDLLVEERIAKDTYRFQKNLERKHSTRMQSRQELADIEQERIHNKQRKKEDNEAFLAMRAKANFEYDSKVAAVNEKRRQNNEDQKRSLLEIMEVNRQERINARKADLRDHNIRMAAQRQEKADIEDERIRILAKQPPQNLRYLPVGVLRKGDEKYLDFSYLKRRS